jgi:hypothetical protein
VPYGIRVIRKKRRRAIWRRASALLSPARPARPKRFESATPVCPSSPNGESANSLLYPRIATRPPDYHRPICAPPRAGVSEADHPPSSLGCLAVSCRSMLVRATMATKTVTGSLHPFARNARIFSTLGTATRWITQSPKMHDCWRIRSFHRLRTGRLNRRIAED